MLILSFATQYKPKAHSFNSQDRHGGWKFHDGIKTISQIKVQDEINLHKLKNEDS